MQAIIDFFTSPEFLWGLCKIAVIIVILVVIKNSGKLLITKIIRKAITADQYASVKDERMREDTLISILNAILKVSIWLFGGMLILAQLGVNIGPLIAGASILGIAIGFGAQTIVQDFVSGLFIILENQYRIGDSVSLAGISGTVESINVRQTVLRDAEGNKHYVPHHQIKTTSNKSIDFSRLVLKIDIAYETNIKVVEKLVNQIGQALTKDKDCGTDILEAPKFVRVNDFSSNAVNILITGKVKAGSQWKVAGIMRQRIKESFETNKIHMPHTLIIVQQKK